MTPLDIQDPTWCYWCDNTRTDCQCASDPSGIPEGHWSTTVTVAPTCESIFNDELGEAVNRTDDATWRHGSYRSEVYRRESDDTFWLVYYRVSTDGETNELREGFAKISQVWPKAVSVIRYLSADKWSAA